eukprot:CAMPEP_0113879784 /NCGR_PEP_ID=MMETSP0780_2-20120614/7425_1 /TAXON_ID=652834 /ORGANISM="Palpitomonas bilix" /LENGTH=680 /DNA_ID=CAMNT_0000866393 /DNA_START=73 /DNA_END=2115 /DNA_ORIENTATION=- /assembly_acc=CAM_ASM_000599
MRSLFVVLCVASLAVCAAGDATSDLNTAHSTLPADLTSKESSQATLSASVSSAFSALVTKQAEVKAAQEAYLANPTTSTAAAVDTKGAELKSALDAWNAAQQNYMAESDSNLNDLVSYREKLTNILNGVQSQGLNAKDAFYAHDGAYASAKSISLLGDFTLEVWVNFDPAKHHHLQLPVISQARVAGVDATKFVFQLKLRGGPSSAEETRTGEFNYYFWDFFMGSSDLSGTAVHLFGNEFQPRGWMHVAVSVSTDGDGVTRGYLFVNGLQEYSKVFTGARWSSSEDILFGMINDNNGVQYSDCLFDEFRVLDGGETDEAVIASHMHSASDLLSAGIRTYLRFDESYDMPSTLVPPMDMKLADSSLHRADGFYVLPSGMTLSDVRVPSTIYGREIDTTRFSDVGLSLTNTDINNQNYIGIPSADLTGQFTMEFWLKHTGASTATYPKVSQATREGSTRDRFVFTLEMVDGSGGGQCKYEFKMGSCRSAAEHTAGTCGYAVEISSEEFACSGWHHVAVQITSTNVAKIFVDGVCTDNDGEPTSAGVCVKRLDASDASVRLISLRPIEIGRLYDDSSYEQVQMEVDEIRLWRSARSQEQIVAHLHRTLPHSLWDQQKSVSASTEDLLAYYTLEEPVDSPRVYDRVLRPPADIKNGNEKLLTGLIHGARTQVARASLFVQNFQP